MRKKKKEKQAEDNPRERYVVNPLLLIRKPKVIPRQFANRGEDFNKLDMQNMQIFQSNVDYDFDEKEDT